MAKRGKYASWTEEDLKFACKAIKEKTLGLNAAARQYTVPKATLKRYLQPDEEEMPIKKKMGRNCSFNESMEDELCRHILLFEKRMFGLTINDVRKLAFDVAETHGLNNSFSTEKKMAGKKWYYGFMKRHPNLSLRQPEATSMARIRGFQKNRVLQFFDLLEETVGKYKLDGTRIFNVDESGFNPVQKKPQKIIAEKGKHQVGCASSGERGVNTTIVVCCNAAGAYVPPMIIFRRKRKPKELELGAPTGSLVEVSDTGYINSDLFILWLNHFSKNVQSNKDNPVLLLLDGHTTHSKNLSAFELAREKGIIMLQLPSHTTHTLQPLDVGFFKPLSTYFIQAQERWLRNHAGMIIGQYQMAELLNEAYGRAAIVRTAENAFRKTGIWPVNRLVFEESNMFDGAAAVLPNEQLEIQDAPISSMFGTDLLHVSPLPQAVASSCKIPTSKPVNDAVLLTASPHVKNLQEKKSIQSIKIRENLKLKNKSARFEESIKAKKARKEKPEETDEETSADDSFPTQDSPDDISSSDDDAADEASATYEHLDIKDISLKEFVVVELEYAVKKGAQKKLFVAQVIQIRLDKKELKCNFMRQSSQLKKVYVFPKIKDEMIIKINQVKRKIQPEFQRRGRYTFPL